MKHSRPPSLAEWECVPSGLVIMPSYARRRLAAVAAAMLLVVTACGGAAIDTASSAVDVAESSESVAAAVETAAPAEAPARGSGVLTGQFNTIDGDVIDFGSLEGQDVVLWFWAPW